MGKMGLLNILKTILMPDFFIECLLSEKPQIVASILFEVLALMPEVATDQ